MNPDQKFQEAIHQEITWKNAEVQRFAVALIRHALEADGNFTTDIVPDEERGTGTGIAGTVVEVLKNGGLLAPVGVTQQGVWYPHRMKSTRPGRNAAWLNVYKLTSRALAEEFMRRNGAMAMQAQLELTST